MTKYPSGEIEPNANILARNYQTSQNVRARFMLYDFADEPMDMEAIVIDGLGLKSNETVVDVGTADGNFLKRLEIEYGHTGLLLGVEPNYTQANKQEPAWDPMSTGELAKSLSMNRNRSKIENIGASMLQDIIKTFDENEPYKFNIVAATADAIPLKSNIAGAVTGFSVLYHLKKDDRPVAFNEFKRLGDRFAGSTSGETNKANHRLIEQEIGEYLSQIGIETTVPAPMNTGFTTEKAKLELPQYYTNVYMVEQNCKMLINTAFRAERYLNSLMSMWNQFDPVPPEEAYREILLSRVYPMINRVMLNNPDRSFIDHISRSAFICSDEPINPGNGFERVYADAA